MPSNSTKRVETIRDTCREVRWLLSLLATRRQDDEALRWLAVVSMAVTSAVAKDSVEACRRSTMGDEL